MIALGIRYLTKYAAAADVAQRQAPEWPPHWGRAFMAMAAGYFEGGESAVERAALEWLEQAPAPALYASDSDHRSAVETYVPVNDEHGGILQRSRQSRVFPRTRPHDECVYYVWQSVPGKDIREGLESVCKKVTRIGHSSSAVQMWVAADGTVLDPNWIPAEGIGDLRMRITGKGTLQMLSDSFNGAAIREYDALSSALDTAKGRQKTIIKTELREKFPAGSPKARRPVLAGWQTYQKRHPADSQEGVIEGPFDADFIVLTKLEGIVLGLESTLQLTGALRDAAMKAAIRPPEWLSGHDSAGQPTRKIHAAFFPLPYVGFKHADGHVMGLGIALPRGMRNSAELRQVLGPLFFDEKTGEERPVRLWKLHDGRKVWSWDLERETRERPPLNLRRAGWTGPSRTWTSVTPVVLHHFPKKDGDVERIVREAFVSALLPEPPEVRIDRISSVAGAGRAMSLPPFTEGGANLCRYQIHMRVRFEEPVRGPVLVGRGRFRGYGLFRPGEASNE